MSWGFLVAALAVAAPLALVEAWAAAGARPWLARGAAVLGSAVIAWIAALPVTLRFFASRDPVAQFSTEMAVGTLLVLLVGHAMLLLAAGCFASS